MRNQRSIACYLCLLATVVLLTLSITDFISWYGFLISAVMLTIVYAISNMISSRNAQRHADFSSIVLGDKGIIGAVLLLLLLTFLLMCMNYGVYPSSKFTTLSLDPPLPLHERELVTSYHAVLPTDIYELSKFYSSLLSESYIASTATEVSEIHYSEVSREWHALIEENLVKLKTLELAKDEQQIPPISKQPVGEDARMLTVSLEYVANAETVVEKDETAVPQPPVPLTSYIQINPTTMPATTRVAPLAVQSADNDNDVIKNPVDPEASILQSAFEVEAVEVQEQITTKIGSRRVRRTNSTEDKADHLAMIAQHKKAVAELEMLKPMIDTLNERRQELVRMQEQLQQLNQVKNMMDAQLEIAEAVHDEEGKQKLLKETVALIEFVSWYLGVLPRDEVERLLINDNMFCVRLSNAQLVLSVRHAGRFYHVTMQNMVHGWTIDGRRVFSDIFDLVQHYVETGEPLVQAENARLDIAITKPSWFLRNDKVKLVEMVGHGFFGKVYLGKYNGSMVAVKVLRKNFQSMRSEFVREGLLLTNFDSPHVVRLRGIAAAREPISLVMDFVNGSSLHTLLRDWAEQGVTLRASQRLALLHDTAKGMQYLEEHDTVHRDLSARNLMLTNDNRIMLTDFGHARIAPYSDVSLGSERPAPPVVTNLTGNATKTSFVYTRPENEKLAIQWTAPEVLFNLTCSSRSDVWSFGILMWEVFADGRRPYEDMSNKDMLVKVMRGYRLPPPSNTTPREIYDLMRLCWRRDPYNRPSFAQIVKELSHLYKHFRALEKQSSLSYAKHNVI